MAASLACGAGAGEGEIWGGEGAGDEVDDAVGKGAGASIDGDITVDVEGGPIAIAVGAVDIQRPERRARGGIDESAILNGTGVEGTEGVAGEQIERGVDDGEAECGDCFRGANDRAGVIEGEISGERQVLIERDGGAMVDAEIGGRDGLAGRCEGRGGAVDVDAAGEVEILGERQGSAGGEADGVIDRVAGVVAEDRAAGQGQTLGRVMAPRSSHRASAAEGKRLRGEDSGVEVDHTARGGTCRVGADIGVGVEDPEVVGTQEAPERQRRVGVVGRGIPVAVGAEDVDRVVGDR